MKHGFMPIRYRRNKEYEHIKVRQDFGDLSFYSPPIPHGGVPNRWGCGAVLPA
jgi:hypothetical protein